METIFKFIEELATKEPMTLLLLFIVLVAIIVILTIRNKGNDSSFDHKEKTSLIALTAQSLAEQKSQRDLHERHHTERMVEQKKTTEAVKLQSQAFRDYHVSIVETIDLTHRETIERLGGFETMLAEIKSYIERFPEMESKVDNLLKILIELKEKESSENAA